MVLNLPPNPNSSINLNAKIDHQHLLNLINIEVDRVIAIHGTIISKLYHVIISKVDIKKLKKQNEVFYINGVVDVSVDGKRWMSKVSGNGTITINLTAKYDFDQESLLTLNIEIKDLSWQSPPIFNIGSSQFSLHNIGDKILSLAQNGIQEKMNERTSTQFNISEIFNNKINEFLPLTTLVNGQDITIYFQNLSINITEFHSSSTDMILRTNIHMEPIAIENAMGIEVNNYQLASSFNFLQPLTSDDDDDDKLQLLTIVSYHLVETLLLNKLQSQPIEILGKSITIHSIKLQYIDSQSVKIDISTDNDMLKEFSINCTIEMDISQQIIQLDKLDLELKNAGFLAKSLMLLEKPILAFVINKINPIKLSELLKKVDEITIDKTKEKMKELGISIDIQKTTTQISNLQLMQEGIRLELITDLTLHLQQ